MVTRSIFDISFKDLTVQSLSLLLNQDVNQAVLCFSLFHDLNFQFCRILFL